MTLALGYFIILIWFAITVIALIIEIETVDLVSIWFVIGGFVTMIFSAILPEEYVWQIVIFLVVSLVSIIAFRPLAKKKLNKNMPTENINSIIGLTGVVTEKVSKIEGRVKVKDTVWSATSDKEILEGTLVEVIEQNNIVLKVKEIEKEEK